jgi:DNA polymerase V
MKDFDNHLTSCDLRSNTIFALVDCNNFFASCERLFRPDLQDKPVVVLSNNDGNIIARSNEAKALGIAMGEPYFKVKGLLKKHGVAVFSSNYTLYGDISQRVMSVLQHIEPDVEIYSIDEMFISIPGGSKLNLTEHGRHMKAVIQKWTGMPVSIGFGPTKTLTKIANRIAKKNPQHKGVFDLISYGNIDELLTGIKVEDIWGIGRQYTKKLNNRGIVTAHDLKHSNDQWIRKHLTITGLRTVWELRGISCLPLEEVTPPKKAIITSKSFSHPVTSLDELREAVATYVSRAAEKLRSQQSIVQSLLVFLTTNRFKPELPQYANSIQMVLPEPTASTPTLIKHSLHGLEKIYRPDFKYKKAGVMLLEIMPEAFRQASLFDQGKNDRKLMGALDCINSRWGRGTVQYAAAGFRKTWMFKREQLSKAYTTRWDQLPVAKASFPLNY